ncbi:hypothetical protein ALO95_200161 [Pseudomonas syringae pv. antirrhini]|uniref:hypothetical protein n=1 Tax=Pseudomonas TaxID=286 RepID=UPI000EFB71E9|nr:MULTISPECIES: hypothetical protein [Pseudomonas]RMP38527.1 hypothetical protein ALQ24_200101 [Pseudomonas syringae pv. antirrhini]RMP41743.1 hypothetical protein ALQ23_200144 [Pseudomonas syringae pv. antirrhini]RMW24158.1 hypothetical protein ALO95_200161 [Pseudomonas syringae pv. antirrhini]WIN10129.1 hypothetical protein QQF68_27815 [Pseudomonas syringae pv. antirrhini str. 126]
MSDVLASENTTPLEEHYEKTWREFNVDLEVAVLRDFRRTALPEVKKLKDELNEFVSGTRELTISSAQRLRANVLRRLQIKHYVDSLLSGLAPKYFHMHKTIGIEFDASFEVQYLLQVNKWLELVESLPTDLTKENA